MLVVHRVRMACCTALVAASVGHAQGSAASPGSPVPRERMDAYFSGLGAYGLSGAVLLMQHGRVVYEAGFGLADRARRVPMTPTTGVDIASMSKDLTAVAVLRLVERGLLTLGDSVSQYLDAVPAEKRGITVAQLLTHRSGLPAYFVEGNDFQTLTRGQALTAILAAQLAFPPGTGSEYSDAGYVLLAILLEQRTGLTLEALLRRDQFAPARLAGTYSYGTPELRAAAAIAHGYVNESDAGSAAAYVHDADYWVVKGAGGIVSTVKDIALWEAALLDGTLLTPASVATLLGASQAGAAAGLAGPPAPLPSGRRGWTRTGAQDFGFAAGVIRYADDSTVAIVAVNRQPDSLDISYLRTRLLMTLDAFVAGAGPEAPPRGRPVPARIAAALAGTYALEDGSTMRIAAGTDGLRLMPDGPLAVDLLAFGPDTSGRAGRLALAARTTAVLSRLCLGDPAPMRATLLRPSARLETFLRNAACPDSTATLHVIGSVPRFWGTVPSRSPASLVAITTATKRTRFRLEWDGERISAVGGSGISAPVVALLASAARDEFVAWDVHTGTTVRITATNRAGVIDSVTIRTAEGDQHLARRVVPVTPAGRNP